MYSALLMTPSDTKQDVTSDDTYWNGDYLPPISPTIHRSIHRSTHRPIDPLRYAFIHSPQPTLKEQIALPLKPQTRFHEHLQRIPLAPERIDDVRAGLDERRLEHVAEQAEDRVQGHKLGIACGSGSGGLTILDAREELGEDHEVEDQRRRKE